MRRSIPAALLLGCVVLIPSLAPARADDDEATAAAKEVAVTWFKKLSAADWKGALEVSDVPFLRDGKKVLKTREELESFHRGVADDKGKRDVEPDKVELGDEKAQETFDEPEMPDRDERVVFNIFIEGERIAVCVRKGEEPKVVGFRD